MKKKMMAIGAISLVVVGLALVLYTPIIMTASTGTASTLISVQ